MSSDKERNFRKTTGLSGSAALAAIDTSVREMPVQKYAVPPKNDPILDFSKSAPLLTKARQGLRTELKTAEKRKNEEIQKLATAKSSYIRERLNKQMATHTFNVDRFSGGVVHYTESIADRLKFIQRIQDDDRKRTTEFEIQKGKQTYEEAEKYVFEYKKAAHLTEPREVIEKADIDREEKVRPKNRIRIAHGSTHLISSPSPLSPPHRSFTRRPLE
jgi:hypothetical protein